MAIAPASEPDTHHEEADAHHPPADPNAAPTHGDVRFTFSFAQMAVPWALGLIALVLGVVLGLTVVNN